MNWKQALFALSMLFSTVLGTIYLIGLIFVVDFWFLANAIFYVLAVVGIVVLGIMGICWFCMWTWTKLE